MTPGENGAGGGRDGGIPFLRPGAQKNTLAVQSASENYSPKGPRR